MQKVLLLYVGNVFLRREDLRNNILFAPFFGVFAHYRDYQLIGLEPHSVDSVIGQTNEYLENRIAQERLMSEYLFEDFNNLALNSPVLGGELLQQRLNDLFLKYIFVQFGRKVLEILDYS